VSQDSHLGVLFLHNEGFSTMCGHGIIALATVAAETGLVRLSGDQPGLKIDTPAGQVSARLRLAGGRVKEVSFLNVPSFVLERDLPIEVPGVGEVKVDVAFGGAFYAFCRARDLGVRLVPSESRRLVELGMTVKHRVMKTIPIRHPVEPELGFLYGTIIVDAPEDRSHHSRNVCIFAEGELDRSPTGTGVSARAAIHFARGELETDEPFVVESILGTCFTGRVASATAIGPYPAVIPEITGRAFITGRQEFLIDPEDPLGHGFLIR